MNVESKPASKPLNIATDSLSTQNEAQGVVTASDLFVESLLQELRAELKTPSRSARKVAERIAREVERICVKSDRIQNSGQVQTWRMTLAKHRLQKCLSYYHLGSRQGRTELHSTLSAIVYRYIAPSHAQLGFQARCAMIEDFMQGFYIESLKAFRRENQLPDTYSPKTQLELAEYMAFTEHYAKRRINLPGCRNQQLIVLRAQGYSNRQPPELSVDIELATESSKADDAEMVKQSAAIQQVREQMVSEVTDPAEGVLRDRVIAELVQYLESQGQHDCVDYLTLKLQDLSAPEIDEILQLTARQRDYLQQRFKYHVEKFARSHQWRLVHQWLGADVNQNLGLSSLQWESFVQQLSPDQQHLLELKQAQNQDDTANTLTDQEIAKALKCTPKQVQKRWKKLLDLAWQVRNAET
ncbi:MAG: HetZ-related protein [Cyanobacteria bacterium]|nr:HetZ-related protein [Cyanobacteriota bacterium]MDW8201378.1 HetZ-related protein [Cyanobacteriota bacterium SKYGB_h_bin112]